MKVALLATHLNLTDQSMPLRTLTLISLLAVSLCPSLPADVTLPSIVSDGMILQRDSDLTVWGWADPDEKVSVHFLGKSLSTTADAAGNWQVSLPPSPAGGPHQMRIAGKNEITLRNILMGDVWLCSGQSNMTHAFDRWQEEYAAEIAASKNAQIRQFRVPTNPILTGPQKDFPGLSWQEADPQSLLEFTVVGYFHAKKLFDKYKVPQGIIMSCVGGTRIEAWTSEAGFKNFPDILDTIERNKDTEYVNRINAEAKADRESDTPPPSEDRGLASAPKWYDPAHQPLNWKSINIPGYWEDQGLRNLDGVVWYRREIEIPAALAGQEIKVKLGRIRNADELYVNGQKVGNTTYEYPQRRYTIPTDLTKPGKNLFVIRVTNYAGSGGFIHDKPYQLEVAGQTIDLKGTWHYKVGEVYRPTRSYKQGISAQSQPSALYNGMIAPFTRYGLHGMLWYQGESNAGNPVSYREFLPNLIADWRQQWNAPNATFLIAQLPNFMDIDFLPPSHSNWAEMREVQLQTALETPNTGLGIAIDLGEWNDIHPGNKKQVGERLALQAMQHAYGETDLVTSGPLFRSQEIVDDTIVLHFDHTGSGLVSSNGEQLAHFAIAGEDKKFVWGDAVIKGDTVVVSSDEVPAPRYVRYAWADNPDFANLGNAEGLPASPFRTDR
ncbi:sialate O-acetylesterase [Pelagicoccus enzymogenes]|uniref:sialate O-acetylesterase n=1 Tax=Pelagicoccus enzymogenes TaxID=2773457 RepID=UPI002810F563|nr:sialate O-acetylesterase [Pelagicoccus enzymogenes]